MPRSVGSKGARAGKTLPKVFGLAPNFQAAYLTIVALAFAYGTALLAVLYAYRKAYGIAGKPELTLRTLGKVSANVCSNGR
jgi:hypothetical protein